MDSSGPLGDPTRVLIVDDDVMLAKALQRVLARDGFRADVACDGAAALEHLGTASYDVMLLDLQLSNMDGMDLHRVIQGRPHPPLTVLHSAYLDVRTAVVAVRSGVRDVMEKPVPEQALSRRLRELAAERRQSIERPGIPRADEVSPAALLRLVGESATMQELRDSIRRVAKFKDLSVLVQGPTGTGKELVAEAIHALSSPDEPFVSINCAAVPEQLFESELFGHEAGAFTNAKGARPGLMEEAGSGTLFLDEIGEMPATLQAKLLRVLETRQFRRVGGNRNRVLSARIVSATNRMLAPSAGQTLRADLFFRIAAYTIATPPLVEHIGDVPVLAEHFAGLFAERHGVPRPTFSGEAMTRLQAHSWPGNVRELRCVVESSSVLARGSVVGAREIEATIEARQAQSGQHPITDLRIPELEDPARLTPRPIKAAQPRVPSVADYASLPDLERDLILGAFVDAGRNLSVAARRLGIPRSTLRDRLKRYGVR